MRRLSVLLALLTAAAPAHAASTSPATAKVQPAFAPVTDTPGLPRVLLIGDSISMGYTLAVRRLLDGRANVHRPPTNCSSSGHGLARLDSWLGSGHWDVIHFNFGLHDAKLPPEGIRHATLERYEQNLRELVARLKATGARLVWASTTPVPNGGFLAPDRRFGDVAAYNRVAARVMTELGVAIDDLNAVITPHFARLARPNDVHYSEEGSTLLARAVADSITAQLTPR